MSAGESKIGQQRYSNGIYHSFCNDERLSIDLIIKFAARWKAANMKYYHSFPFLQENY